MVDNLTTFPKLGVKLDVFNSFVDYCGGADSLAGLTTADVNERFVKALTYDNQSSYCDLLKSQYSNSIGVANVFISHAWKFIFLDVVSCLNHHFKNETDSVVLWFDLFSNNQHFAPNLDFTWWSTTFKSAIEQFGRTVLVLSPWFDPIPLKRAWCLFEIYCTVETKSQFEIAMSEIERDNFIEQIQMDVGIVKDMIGKIDVQRSEAYKEEDKILILSNVQKTVGFNRINGIILEQIRDWVIQTAESSLYYYTQQLQLQPQLSNPLQLQNTPYDDPSEKLYQLKTAVGDLYLQKGKYTDAIELYLDCYEYYKRISPDTHGTNDPMTMTALGNLALVYIHQGRYEIAEEIYVKLLSQQKKYLGQNHPASLDSLLKLGILYIKMEKFLLSEPLLLKCWELSKKVLGEDDERTLSAMHSIGNLYVVQKKYIQAENILTRCLQMRKVRLGISHPQTLSLMANVASVFHNLKLLSRAEVLYLKVQELQEIRLGDDHPDYLLSLHNLGTFYYTQSKLLEAKTYITKAYEQRRKTLGIHNPATQASMKILAMIYSNEKDSIMMDKAEELYRELIELRQYAYSNSNNTTDSNSNNTANTTISNNAANTTNNNNNTNNTANTANTTIINNNNNNTAPPPTNTVINATNNHQVSDDNTNIINNNNNNSTTPVKKRRSSSTSWKNLMTQLGQIYYKNGKYDKAAAVFQELIISTTTNHTNTNINTHTSSNTSSNTSIYGSNTSSNSSNTGVDRSEWLYLLAKTYNKRGDYDAAEPLFVEFLHRQNTTSDTSNSNTTATATARMKKQVNRNHNNNNNDMMMDSARSDDYSVTSDTSSSLLLLSPCNAIDSSLSINMSWIRNDSSSSSSTSPTTRANCGNNNIHHQNHGYSNSNNSHSSSNSNGNSGSNNDNSHSSSSSSSSSSNGYTNLSDNSTIINTTTTTTTTTETRRRKDEQILTASHRLAALYMRKSRCLEATPLLLHCLSSQSKHLGMHHPYTKQLVKMVKSLLRALKKERAKRRSPSPTSSSSSLPHVSSSTTSSSSSSSSPLVSSLSATIPPPVPLASPSIPSLSLPVSSDPNPKTVTPMMAMMLDIAIDDVVKELEKCRIQSRSLSKYHTGGSAVSGSSDTDSKAGTGTGGGGGGGTLTESEFAELFDEENAIHHHHHQEEDEDDQLHKSHRNGLLSHTEIMLSHKLLLSSKQQRGGERGGGGGKLLLGMSVKKNRMNSNNSSSSSSHDDVQELPLTMEQYLSLNPARHHHHH